MARLKKAGWYLHQLLRGVWGSVPLPRAEVFLDVQNRSRRFLLLAHLFHGAGVALRVHWTWKQFLALNDRGYAAFRLARVVLRASTKTLSDSGLTITDGVLPLPSARPSKTLLVQYSSSPLPDPLPPRTIFIPISFHPNLMTQTWYDRARELAQRTKRTMGVFFAGNFDPKTYDKPHFRTEYGMLNRYEILQIVRSDEFRDWVYEPESWEQFEQDRCSGILVDRFVVIDTKRFAVPQNQWLETLGEARYFLAPPGYTQPFSHNLVEALSVGTVPLVNYGHLFRPRLVDGDQALTFDTEDGLRRLLRRLRDDATSSWDAQRARAWSYQEEHLSPQSTAEKVRSVFLDPSDEPWTMIFAGSKT